jgi:hypothetical protein
VEQTSSNRKKTILAVILVAAALVLAAILAGGRLINGDRSLLRNVEVSDTLITPNADGETDATPIRYQLSRNATVSIYFENEAGERFYFRQEKPRGTGKYEVLFSGVVDGYRLPDDTFEGEILARLLRDGDYTWTIEATDFDGNAETATGTITIANADSQLPELRNFSLDKQLFTPNRDGIDDRVLIQYYLPKEVAGVRVFVQLPDGRELPIAEQEREIPANMPGRHYHDYEGGVDNGETPPPDGTYAIVAVAEDLEGQQVRVEDELTLQFGGVPRADIFSPPTGNTVQWNTTAVALCDTIVFTMTVENYGTTPIRTTGPEPGTVYDSDWNYNTLGWHTESGAWRAAIGFENELTNYPFRWALGNLDELTKIGDHYYLMPGDRAVITGGVRVVDVFGDRNPQPIWAGLIHEDVEITEFNNRVDPRDILVDIPGPATDVDCEPRSIPVRQLPASN